MNIINIADRQKKIHFSKNKIKSLVEQILDFLGIENRTVSILFVNDEEIRKLNKIYRNKNTATDVLAFSMQEGRFAKINPEILGDVVISLETAKRCAAEQKTTFTKEMSLYLIHGILHLRGYADEGKSRDVMRAKEKKIFQKLWNEEN